MSSSKSLLNSSALAGALALSLMAGGALAQDRIYNIPAESLSKALRDYGQASSRQLIFTEDLVQGRTSPPLRGAMSPQAALARLLEGTGLEAETNPTGAIMIVRTPRPQPAGAAPAPAVVSEVTVTGTRIEGAPAQGAVELKTYGREQIVRSGQPTVAGFLNTLPEVSQSSFGSIINTFDSQTSVSLRGFPAGATLVLLDGQRVAVSGDSGTFFDLSNIPQAMVERIDIVPIGSSSIYGSDAIAGVVNIITRKRFEGVALDAKFGAAADYTDQTLSLAAGKTWDRGSAMLSATYQRRGELFGFDRALTANQDYSRFAAAGGSDVRNSFFCLPGTVETQDGANLDGLTSAFAAIPAGIAGRPTVGQFAATAGTRALCGGSITPLAIFPRVSESGVLGAANYRLTDRIELFSSVILNHIENSTLAPVTFGSFTVPASNAFNPFNQTVSVDQGVPTASGNVAHSDFVRALVGAKGPLVGPFDWEVTASTERTWERTVGFGVQNSSQLSAALASNDPATAFNPFSISNPKALIDGIWSTNTFRFRSHATYVEGVIRGPLLQLPSGPVQAVLGASYQNEYLLRDLSASDPVTGITTGSRNIGAVFGEVRVPLLANDAAVLSAAARYSDYSDFGSKVTPQFGLEMRPIPGLLLRASYAKAFRAPSLFDINGARSTFDAVIEDPLNGNVSVVVPIVFGGNPNLDAETGDSKSLGLVWTGTPGLAASATYWWLNEDNRISVPTVAALLANPTLFPGRIVRDATGQLVSIDESSINFGGLRSQGFDIDLSYTWQTPLGDVHPFADVTATTKFLAAIRPDQPLVDRLGTATFADAWAPRWKGAAGVGWNRGPFSASLSGRYLGRYLDYQPPANGHHLGGFVLWDAYARYDLGRDLFAQNRFAKNTYVAIAATNLFDRPPQYSNAVFGFIGYDPVQADLLGRLVTITLGAAW